MISLSLSLFLSVYARAGVWFRLLGCWGWWLAVLPLAAPGRGEPLDGERTLPVRDGSAAPLNPAVQGTGRARDGSAHALLFPQVSGGCWEGQGHPLLDRLPSPDLRPPFLPFPSFLGKLTVCGAGRGRTRMDLGNGSSAFSWASVSPPWASRGGRLALWRRG